MKHCYLNPVYLDRKVAKMKFSLLTMLIIILFLPAVLTLIAYWLSSIPGHSSVLQEWADNSFWGYYSSYVNPNVKYADGSFLKKIFEMAVSVLGIIFVNGILVSLIVSWMEGRGKRWREGDLHYDRVHFPMMKLKNYAVIIGGNEIVPNLASQLLNGYIDYSKPIDKNDPNLKKKFEDTKYDYVLVMTNRNIPELRKKLKSILGNNEERVVVYHGERDSKEDLKHLQIEKAGTVYVIGEELDIDQKGSEHDVLNMQCVRLIAELLKNSVQYKKHLNNGGKKKLCRVMYEYQSSFSAFQFTDVNPEISDFLNFRPFNYYENWAQKVLVCPEIDLKRKKVEYLPLEGKEPITADSEDHVHLIVIGMSRMGVALGIEAAHLAHYPNFYKVDEKGRPVKPGPRTRITFIDKVAKTGMQFFQGYKRELFAVSRWRFVDAEQGDFIYYTQTGHLKYDDPTDKTWKDPLHDSDSHSPYKGDTATGYTLGEDFVDVEWEFIQGELENPKIQHYIRDAAIKDNVRLTIAVCVPRDNSSFAGSLYLPDEVYDMKNNVVQVLAYQPYGDAMCKSFKNQLEIKGKKSVSEEIRFNQFGKLRAFGMIEGCYDVQIQSQQEFIESQLWEQYQKTYEGRIGGRNDLRKQVFGEDPLKAGKSLAAQQWSNTYAALHLWTKLRSVKWNGEKDLEQQALDDLAILEHSRWNLEQLLLGFAPLKSDQQKKLRDLSDKAKYQAQRPLDKDIDMIKKNQKPPEISQEEFKKKRNKLSAWLNAWKKFDETREIMKTNMGHLDICSFDVLKDVDEEAVQYDRDLTAILTKIYNVIKEATDRPDNQ